MGARGLELRVGSWALYLPGDLPPPCPSLLCSDGEAPGGNPLVAGFQDDVDVEDKPPSRPLRPPGPLPKENIASSSAEEAEGLAAYPTATVLVPQKCSEPESKRYVDGSHPRGGGSQEPPDPFLVPKALHKGCEAAQGCGSQGGGAPPARRPQVPHRGPLWRA